MGVKKKIYIAGPMSGLPDFNRNAFDEKQAELESKGYLVMNPAIFPLGFEEKDYMALCMSMLMACDSIYMLDGWHNSDGAKAEYSMAIKLEMNVIEA